MLIGLLTAGRMPEEVAAREGDYRKLYTTMFEGEGFTFREWMVVDGDIPDTPGAADGWLIGGSRHGVYDDLPWIPPLMQFVRDIASAGRPLVGICFGHQLIAQALGGRVEKYPGGWIVGRQNYDWHGEQRALNAWHQDQVIAPPERAKTVASAPDCRHAALRYGPRIMSVQPHPEFTEGVVEGLLDTRAPGVVPHPLIEGARAQLGRANDAGKVVGDLAATLKGTAP